MYVKISILTYEKKLIDMWKLYQYIKIHMISRYDMKKKVKYSLW